MLVILAKTCTSLICVGLYHYAVGEAGDEGVLDGDGGEVDGAEVAGKDLSEGAEGILWHKGEDGRACEVPELLGLHHEFPIEVAGAGDRIDVSGTGGENCGGSSLWTDLMGFIVWLCGVGIWVLHQWRESETERAEERLLGRNGSAR